jgi:hypothetical protein
VELAWYPRFATTIRNIPISEWARHRAWKMYVSAVMGNKLAGLVALLQRVRPLPPITEALLPTDLLREYRAFATTLRNEPLYAPYAREYLSDETLSGDASASFGRQLA